MELITKFFSTRNEREVKRLNIYVNKITQQRAAMVALKDEEFHGYTQALKEKIAQGAPLNSLVVEAFALVREAAKRSLQMEHFEVQLIGGLVLYEGNIAEMKTGEGKTLAATLTAYLRALEGKGVHVVTVNDHLAKRDALWMSPVYEKLGLSVSFLQHGLSHEEKQRAYAADITYGTNNEFGFDYLRDNMVIKKEDKVQRDHYFCIIDEVDSILIDEARTPLIISGPSESNVEKYYHINRIIPLLKQAQKGDDNKDIPGTGDYYIDIKDKNVTLTDDGVQTVEKHLSIENLYGAENTETVHHLTQALKAHKLFSRDVDYIVEDGHVKIIDEFTGRKMEGRHFSDGLHQAIQAKEAVKILSENQTIATITLQNYFRLYKIKSGMTGTALTEAEEFKKIYNLDVISIPSNQKVIRRDETDKIYRTEREKIVAIVNKVKKLNIAGQPVLIGAVSVEKSEKLSKMLNHQGIEHELLNAKQHEREAQIVLKAGQRGAVTIATNMAGRGTDIKIDASVSALGGLMILGSERHESRRIDNQLRGRSGRQGDPGLSIFYISLEDELIRRFQSPKLSQIMLKLGMKEGDEISHPLISRQIESAQKKIEGLNFDIRKYLIEYDDVINIQRSYIYKERNLFLEGKDTLSEINLYLAKLLETQLEFLNEGKKQKNSKFYERTKQWCEGFLEMPLPFEQPLFLATDYDDILLQMTTFAEDHYLQKRKTFASIAEDLERYVLLRTLDSKWKEHLLNMDHLREGISLRAYGERKPLTEFKREGFRMFKEMVAATHLESVQTLFKLRLKEPEERGSSGLGSRSLSMLPGRSQSSQPRYQESRQSIFSGGGSSAQATLTKTAQTVKNFNKIGRNEPCHCGSGKKYKHCCLRKEGG